MKIVHISGARNEKGQTAKAANAVLEGATKAGADTETILLPKLKIERCRQCNQDGWGLCATRARCIIDTDDFAAVFEKLTTADLILFSTPVYLWEPAESLLAFMDRMRRICFTHGQYVDLKHKACAILAVAGGGGSGTIKTLEFMEQNLLFAGFDIVDFYPLKRHNLEAKLPQLRLAGEWLASKPETWKPGLD